MYLLTYYTVELSVSICHSHFSIRNIHILLNAQLLTERILNTDFDIISQRKLENRKLSHSEILRWPRWYQELSQVGISHSGFPHCNICPVIVDFSLPLIPLRSAAWHLDCMTKWQEITAVIPDHPKKLIKCFLSGHPTPYTNFTQFIPQRLSYATEIQTNRPRQKLNLLS